MATCKLCAGVYDGEAPICDAPACVFEWEDWLQCPICMGYFKPEPARGRRPVLCSPECRKIHKQRYHKNYDAQPEQKQRRLTYMKEKACRS